MDDPDKYLSRALFKDRVGGQIGNASVTEPIHPWNIKNQQNTCFLLKTAKGLTNARYTTLLRDGYM